MTRSIYLALGDSITAGHGASHPRMAFVKYVSDFNRAKLLAEKTIVLAKNGWTTKDIWQATHLMHPSAWEQVNVLTLMAGGNDLRNLLRRQYLSISGAPISPQLVYRRLEEFHSHMNRLCNDISRRKIPHVLVATVYNPVPNFPLAVQAIEELNNITINIAEHYQFGVIDVYTKFQHSELLYINGYRSGRFEDLSFPFHRPIHPNNFGHKEIATLITSHLENRFEASENHPTKKK